jgi:zinc-ribbon domain
MPCSSCGTPLPEGATYCPRCGAMAPHIVSLSGLSPDDPTAASPPTAVPELPPPNHYGSPPYGGMQPGPYEPGDYNIPYPLTPPPPPFTRRFFGEGGEVAQKGQKER